MRVGDPRLADVDDVDAVAPSLPDVRRHLRVQVLGTDVRLGGEQELDVLLGRVRRQVSRVSCSMRDVPAPRGTACWPPSVGRVSESQRGAVGARASRQTQTRSTRNRESRERSGMRQCGAAARTGAAASCTAAASANSASSALASSRQEQTCATNDARRVRTAESDADGRESAKSALLPRERRAVSGQRETIGRALSER